MWTVKLPTYLTYGKRKPKNFHLNLNVYRNAPFHLLNQMKVQFESEVAPLIQHLPVFDKVRIGYHYVVGTKRECDVANVCCIVDKFFCDLLTKQGKLTDDNYKYLTMVAYGYGGYEKGNPYVEAQIEAL